MKKLKYCLLFATIALGFSSCLKDDKFLDVSNTQPIVEFPFGSDGTSSISWGPLADTTVVDTAIAINLASPQVLDYDVVVNLKLDQAVIDKYNAANPTNLLTMLPDSAFSGPSNISITIPAGYRIGKIPIKLYPDKIDASVSFGMPYSIVSITSSGPAPIVSTNSSAILYAFIGNPIAGSYTEEWIRYNTATQTGTPAFDELLPGVLFSPESPTQVRIATQGTGVEYVLSFENNGGVLSNFKVSIDPASAAGLTITTGPDIVLADPVARKFTFNFTYLNSAGAARNITDIFTPE